MLSLPSNSMCEDHSRWIFCVTKITRMKRLWHISRIPVYNEWSHLEYKYYRRIYGGCCVLSYRADFFLSTISMAMIESACKSIAFKEPTTPSHRKRLDATKLSFSHPMACCVTSEVRTCERLPSHACFISSTTWCSFQIVPHICR